MKSHEQRIKDAAAEFRLIIGEFPTSASNEEIATRLLEAADHEPPQWPTDESLRAYFDVHGWYGEGADMEYYRRKLRTALLVDPIIKAAIEMRHTVLSAIGPVGPDDARAVQAVIDAVNEARL